ncbi:MFS family permease [Psychromicrobium silvestre]|uniref:MFS family permease n=1 Tax=Psychromicrobium silvestre TaxID=1645614 RepID=A0A7Y9LSD2_9MICC|nr:MFS transporter [Psychromicrobium silvestre]NYE94697.1 MFS family permease [Psychromicrobium silvestre]
MRTQGKKATILLSGAGAVVGFLFLVELTSGVLQGYYTPLLTDIARHLNIRDADVNWFEAAQLLVSALVVPVLAKLGDMFGHRRILLLSTALTAVASWAVAFAPDFWTFLIAWALQGFYVVWLPLEIALIYSRSQQSADPAALTRRAAGILVAGLEFGVILGALIGGKLGEVLSGKLWLTLMIPAICVSACFLVIWRGVPESPSRTGGRIDTKGFILITLALLLMTAGLTFMRIDGPGTWWAWLSIALGVGGLLYFARYELRQPDPLVDIRLFRQPSMWPVQLTAFLFGVSVLGAQAPLSTFAQTQPSEVGYGLGVGSGQVSLLIGVYVLALLAGALLFPSLVRLSTPRVTLIGAAILVGVGYLLFLPFHDQLWQVMLNMLIAGLGSGALVAALPSAAAAAAPLTQTGMATGLTNATKTLGGSFASCIFGIALASQAAGAVSHSTAGSLSGYLLVWTICGITGIVAAVLLFFVPKLAFGGTLPGVQEG